MSAFWRILLRLAHQLSALSAQNVQWPAGKTLGTPDTFPMVKGLVVPLDKMRRAHDKMSECVVLGREEVGLSTIISTMLSAVLLSGIW